MDFRILGPLEVLDEGRLLALPGSKQRALLALLLLHVNETLTADRLIDELWAGRPPATAAKTLHAHVSRLRKALATEGDVVVTRAHGYELRLDPGHLDAHRFERLVAEGRGALATGRPERATAALEEALALWRGAALADLAYEPFVQREIARLEELRVSALEELIEAKLALGGHAELVGQLEALIADHPFRERLRAQLMLALYRSDRQADALQAYQHARRTLVDQLGIEPGERLRQLERAILAQDPTLNLQMAERPGAPQPAVMSTGSAFVGRERELAELAGGLDDACAGRGRVLLLAGEPGIGKSRLADELIAHARARGAQVLVGRCWEAGGAPPYWPWVQALRAYVGETAPDVLRAQLGAGAADLAVLLPDLLALFPELEKPSHRSDGARFRLFDAAGSFLRAAARAEPLVLVFDDLHAADEPSLLLLRFVARAIADCRLLVVCAFRDVDPAMPDALGAAVAELVREPHTSQMTLTGLTDDDAAEYIQLVTGAAPAQQLIQAVQAETNGNPLFLSEVVRMLDAHGRLAEPDARPGIPESVRAVIRQRVRRLSGSCRRALVPACVLGREFGLKALEQLCGLSHAELIDALDEAMTERIITEVPGSPDRLRFGHALIRDTLYDELTPARRFQLHEDAGRALEAAHSVDLEPHLGELAHHFLAAAPGRTTDEAIVYARRAGDRAASQLAYEEAVRLYETALPLAEQPVTRCELLLALGDAQARAGETDASKRTFREAANTAEAGGLDEHLGRAALGYGGRIMWEVSRGDEYHVPLLERALAAVGEDDSALRVRLLARLAGGPLRDAAVPAARRRALSEEALRAARRMDDPATLGYAIQGYILGHHGPDHTRAQLELATELIELAAQVGDKERVVDGHEERLDALIELGEMVPAKEELQAMATVAQELMQPSQIWLVSVYRALVALLEGSFDEAERLIAATRALGERAQSWNAAVTYRLQLYVLRREQGRLGEIENLVRQSAEAYPTYPIWRCVLAQTAAELGYADDARGEFERLATDGFAHVPFDEEWLVSMGLLAETASALDDAERAAELHELLAPYGDRVAVSYPEISIGAVARYLGLLAVTAGRWEDVEHDFQAALEINERIGARPWLAHSRCDYARALLARGTAGNTQKARTLLSASLATYRELGMHARVARASALAAEAGAATR
jgi:DNA-binding SARP family transcriptional activator